MSVEIRQLSGDNFWVPLEGCVYVRDLKQRIVDTPLTSLSRLPRDVFYLIHQHTVMYESDTLEQHQIVPGEAVYVVQKLGPSPPGS